MASATTPAPVLSIFPGAEALYLPTSLFCHSDLAEFNAEQFAVEHVKVFALQLDMCTADSLSRSCAFVCRPAFRADVHEILSRPLQPLRVQPLTHAYCKVGRECLRQCGMCLRSTSGDPTIPHVFSMSDIDRHLDFNAGIDEDPPALGLDDL